MSEAYRKYLRRYNRLCLVTIAIGCIALIALALGGCDTLSNRTTVQPSDCPTAQPAYPWTGPLIHPDGSPVIAPAWSTNAPGRAAP
jgi:hypothetical protein